MGFLNCYSHAKYVRILSAYGRIIFTYFVFPKSKLTQQRPNISFQFTTSFNSQAHISHITYYISFDRSRHPLMLCSSLFEFVFFSLVLFFLFNFLFPTTSEKNHTLLIASNEQCKKPKI